MSVCMAMEESPAQDTAILKQVTVTGKKPLVQVLPGKTIINVDAAASNSGATLFEVLEKSPGISFDRDGNISLKGRQGVLLMIDGKPAQVSGSDLNNLINGMTASQIDQIEIMDNPTSRYDAAGSAGIINIKTKKTRQKGFNGNLSATVGQGRYTRTINTLTLNRYAGKINVFGTIGVNLNKNFSDFYAFRKYYADDDYRELTTQLEQPSFFRGRAPTQYLKLGLDYFITKKTTLGMVISGNALTRRSVGNNTAIWMNSRNEVDSIIQTTSNNKDRIQTGHRILQHQTRFKVGKHCFYLPFWKNCA